MPGCLQTSLSKYPRTGFCGIYVTGKERISRNADLQVVMLAFRFFGDISSLILYVSLFFFCNSSYFSVMFFLHITVICYLQSNLTYDTLFLKCIDLPVIINLQAFGGRMKRLFFAIHMDSEQVLFNKGKDKCIYWE